MSDKYRIKDNDKAYFITMTTVGWVDVFTRKEQKLQLINSIKYCQKNKELVVFAYCLMPSHLHMICKADEGFNLSDILRDFKTYTSKKIIEIIHEEPESRRECLPAGEAGMLDYFSTACKHLKRNQKFKVWQDGNHAKEIFSSSFLYEKLEYIHNNPVEDLIVEKPEDYLFSSARNYAGLDSYLDILLLDHKPLITNWK
jgi:REP element-mobilizing transposase RayT